MENKDMTSAMETLIKSSFNVKINMNDTFYYACADSSEVDSEDAMDLLPFIQEYGFDALIAYEAIKRDHDPQIPDYVTEPYKEVKQKLIDAMSADENFLVDLNFQKKKEAKEIAEFGGKLYYKWVQPTFFERKIKRQRHMTCVCHIEGKKTTGKGSNMATAIEDLRSKVGSLK